MMKITLTESQFKRLVENIVSEESREDAIEKWEEEKEIEDWFVKLLDNLEETKSKLDKYKSNIFWVNKDDGKIFMELVEDRKLIFIDYSSAWEKIKERYDYEDEQISNIIKQILGEHMNIWGYTPMTINFWERTMEKWDDEMIKTDRLI